MYKYYELNQYIAGFRSMRHAIELSDEWWTPFQKPHKVADIWKTPKVIFCPDDELDELVDFDPKARRDSDCPWIIWSFFPAFSNRAKDSLNDLLGPYGEFLPIDGPENLQFYYYHCTNRVDLTDRLHSDGQISRRTGTLRTLRKPVLIPHNEFPGHVFDLNFYGYGQLTVSEEVVKRVKEMGLKGFEFTPVPVCQICIDQ